MTGFLTRSVPESERFGFNVARARLAEPDFVALDAEVRGSDVDLAIVRVPAGSEGVGRLTDPTIHADTLVYYQVDLHDHAPRELRNGQLDFRAATSDDAASLDVLVQETFADYTSHYHANPALDPADVLAGYEEWARGFIGPDGRIVTLAFDGEDLAGFAAWELRGEEAEGVLYGVSPLHAGRGLYGDLIRQTQREARAHGASRMIVSTQVHNYAVQKVWAREGFHMYQAWDTHHVLAWNDAGRVAFDDEVTFSADDVARFAEVTGDRNPIHVDLAAARESGFRERIAHGVLVLGEVSRILGTVDPGHGTIIANEATHYFGPVLAGERYRLRLTIIGDRSRPRRATGVARIQDLDCALVVKSRFSLVVPA
jgi:acyl dehydratase/GNAT superfamily N-acetyltransferase